MTNNRKVVRQETGGTPGKYNKKSLNLSVVPTGADAFTTLKLRSFVITSEMFALLHISFVLIRLTLKIISCRK